MVEEYQSSSQRSERLLFQSMAAAKNNSHTIESSSSSAAPASVNTLSRVVIEDQVTRGLTDYLRCGICFNILT